MAEDRPDPNAAPGGLEDLAVHGRRPVPPIDPGFADRLEASLRVAHARHTRRTRSGSLGWLRSAALGVAVVVAGVLGVIAFTGDDAGLPISVVPDASAPSADFAAPPPDGDAAPPDGDAAPPDGDAAPPDPFVEPTPSVAPSPSPVATPSPSPAATPPPSPSPSPSPVAAPSPSPVATPSPSPVAAPGDIALQCGLRSSDRGAAVSCTWEPPSDDAAIRSYELVRNRNGAGPEVAVETRPATTQYLDTDFDAGDELGYIVRALGADDRVVATSNRQIVTIARD